MALKRTNGYRTLQNPDIIDNSLNVILTLIDNRVNVILTLYVLKIAKRFVNNEIKSVYL